MYRLQILIILICTPLLAASQGVSGGALFEYTHTISDRWNATTLAEADYSHIETDFVWGKIDVGAEFDINEAAYIFAKGRYSYGKYLNISNKDIIMRIIEGISIRAKHYNISHTLFFDQSLLRYRPSGYENTCTRFNYTFAKTFEKMGSSNYHQIALHTVFNMRSDVQSATILQRCKVQYTLGHRLQNNNEIGLYYIYMVCGKNQTYLEEAHNLHRIVLFFKINN